MEVQVIKKKIIKKNKDEKLRVCAYARVSSLELTQPESFESQKKYYTQKIKNNPNYIFCGIYSDKGVTGSSVKKRRGFQKMIIDADNNKFDLILTKNVSRFARNTFDALKYVKFLKSKNIGVYFEEENINTLSMESELIITILSSVAQAELENMRANIKYGLRETMKRGKLTGFSGCYGYDYNPETLEFKIIEEEAKVVKYIFNLYLRGYGIGKIARILNEKKIPTKFNKVPWRDSVVLKMLHNEKYVGDVLLNKFITVGDFDEKHLIKNDGYEDQYYTKNHHEPIISRETYNEVQELMKSKYKNCLTINNGAHNRYEFSRKMRCGFCGASLMRTKCANNPYYRCRVVRNKLNDKCNESRSLKINTLKEVFVESLNEFKNTKLKIDNAEAKEKIKYVYKVLKNQNIDKYSSALFEELIHGVVFGKEGNPFYIKFILRTNNITNEYPTKESIQNDYLYKVLCYKSKIKTNYRIHTDNTLHFIDNIEVEYCLDLSGDI